ncbi:MAG: DUF885 domain-containing protein [Bryobacteraceae bacterium]
MRYILQLALVLAALPAPAQEPNAALHRLFHDYYEDLLRHSPELATSVGRREYNDRWSDLSASGRAAWRSTVEQYRQRLDRFRGTRLNRQDALSYELLNQQIARELEGWDLNNYYLPVSQMRGVHLSVFSLMALAPTETVKDYENLIARIRALPRLAGQVAESADTAIAKNLVQPRLVAELVVKQLENQLAIDPAQSPLLAPFRKFPASIPEPERQRLRREAETAYREAFVPAWTKLRDYMANSYLPKARAPIGMSALPDGGKLYAFLVRRETTTDLTPDQIHEIGLREVKRIQDEMAAIRREIGFQGTPDEFVEKVLHAPDLLFRTEEEILVHGRDIAKRIDPELPKLFRKLPRMTYGVKAIPPDRAKTAAPYYQPPALDGSRAGFFFLRTHQPETQSRCCMESLIVHEAVPGHHLQIALAQEMENVPEFRKLSRFTAYIEGWGLYAETLGEALGMYTSPYERYGRLQTEIMRAVRLVVDTGIHAKGWTREQAIEMMRLAKGGFITEGFIASEVDRYIAMPAQALAYKVGGLKIEELRRESEAKLGDRFDVREFHDVVLRNGALPLTLLEREVREYISARQRRQAAGPK